MHTHRQTDRQMSTSDKV